MILTFHQLRDTFQRRLREANLEQFINKERSQFLDLDGEVFVEIVVNDGSVVENVEEIVRLVADESKAQGVSVDSIVRALWQIVSVEYVGPSPYRFAAEFRVVLRSGARRCEVIVDVHSGAIELLEQKLGLRETRTSDALPEGHVVREMVAPVVRRFVEQNLSRGGTSYWDPLQNDHVELTSTDMSFLMGQSTAFEELRQAIADAFDPSVLESFLGSLTLSHANVERFEEVLPELSNMLGGAYKRGQVLSTSANELYGRLERTEQELLKKYFQGKISRLKADPRFADLVTKYSSLLGAS